MFSIYRIRNLSILSAYVTSPEKVQFFKFLNLLYVTLQSFKLNPPAVVDCII
jgi:hypothetical protein